MKRFVYGSNEQTVVQKRKSFSTPTGVFVLSSTQRQPLYILYSEISKLALTGESAATKQSQTAVGALVSYKLYIYN